MVAELQKLFIGTWEKQKGEPLACRNYFPPADSPAAPRWCALSAAHPTKPYSLIYATLISALRSAVSEIWITNAYFVPDPQLKETLKAAAARGVDVKAGSAQQHRFVAGVPRWPRELQRTAEGGRQAV